MTSKKCKGCEAKTIQPEAQRNTLRTMISITEILTASTSYEPRYLQERHPRIRLKTCAEEIGTFAGLAPVTARGRRGSGGPVERAMVSDSAKAKSDTNS